MTILRALPIQPSAVEAHVIVEAPRGGIESVIQECRVGRGERPGALQLLSELDDVTKRGDQLRALLNDRLSDPPEQLVREMILRSSTTYTVEHPGSVVAAAASGTDLHVALNGFSMVTGLPPNLEPLPLAFNVRPGDKLRIIGGAGWARLSVKG